MAFEHHGAESSPDWEKAGRQRGGQGRRKRGSKTDASDAQDPRMARQAGYWGVSRTTTSPPPRRPPAKATQPMAALRPRDSGFPLSRARGTNTATPGLGWSPPAPNTHVLSAEEGALGRENGQDKTLPAHPKSQPHPLHPSASAAPGRPGILRPGPHGAPVGAARALQGREWE